MPSGQPSKPLSKKKLLVGISTLLLVVIIMLHFVPIKRTTIDNRDCSADKERSFRLVLGQLEEYSRESGYYSESSSGSFNPRPTAYGYCIEAVVYPVTQQLELFVF